MRASKLIRQLQEIADEHGLSLDDINVNFRYDYNSDVHNINHVFEDLYDEKTGTTLESISLLVEFD
jgi:hypothetical protein